MAINSQSLLIRKYKQTNLVNATDTQDTRLLVIRLCSLVSCILYASAWFFQSKQIPFFSLNAMFYPLLFIVHSFFAIILFIRPLVGSYLKKMSIFMLVCYGIFYIYLLISQDSNQQYRSIAVAPEWLLLIYAIALFVLDLRVGIYVSLSIFAMICVALMLSIYTSFSEYHIAVLKYAQITSLIYIPALTAIAYLRERYIKIQELAQIMSQAACIDELTNIYNRRFMNLTLEQLFEQANRYNTSFSLIIFDIDKFKKINDTYGHDQGDKVLQQLAKLIEQQLRKIDVFGRWGGEEFMIILPSTNDIQSYQLAERLRSTIEEHTFPGLGPITASFGLTSYIPQDTPTTLIKRADTALYQAKQNGRNCLVVS